MGAVLVVAGALLILAMPLSLLARIAATVAWLYLGGRDIATQRRAQRDYCGLMLDRDGKLELLDHDGNWLGARLLPGSILLRRLGWIRIRDRRGRVFAEPLRGDCRRGQDWRRLQVLWRHVGAST